MSFLIDEKTGDFEIHNYARVHYSRYENVFAWLCAIISAAAGIWAMRGRKGNQTGRI